MSKEELDKKETQEQEQVQENQEPDQAQEEQEPVEQKVSSYEELKSQLSDKIKQARVNSGRSVDDIAYQINIPVPNLTGMEDGSAYETMEKVFVRGYLINYAKALELDGDELVELLNRIYIARDMDPVDDKQIDQAKKPVSAYSLRDLEKPNDLPLIKIIPPILITILIIGGGFYWQLSNPPAVPETVEIEIEEEPEFAEISSPYVEEYQNTTEEVAIEPAEEIAPPVGISMSFTADTWVEIVDSREKIYAWRIFTAGQSETLSGGVPPYSVLIGNVRATTISYNGVEIDLQRFLVGNNVARVNLPLNWYPLAEFQLISRTNVLPI